MTFKVYVRDTNPQYGGWFEMETIEASSEAEALELAKEVYGNYTKVKQVTI